ncbi:hypothetical protein A2115_02865 [Candidatus Woesebacteria bacterium GWA1_41_8]|uniref:Activator of Hsp90 ATPase homologue 1/2-like C-terminal domain-containing protein n=1 Tax=Candidatus Woesebacteria bacterium GWA1_41_8 TaxID=1802471 RepID=A0A1F7WHV0_9BACT|nr:MAG: hypothetical protein A2115_02865 [Candidatus Woesebacteria bacterium GWA1_41_8]
MKTIRKRYLIKAPVVKVWQALINPNVIEKWGGGPAKMSEKTGEEFSLWGGEVHGKNIEVVVNKKLVQEWSSGNWPSPSIATFVLTEKNGSTVLKLLHNKIPDGEAPDIDDVWDLYYLGEIKRLLENS